MAFVLPQSVHDIPTVQQLVQIADQTVAGLQKPKERIALLLRRHMISAVTQEDVGVPNVLVLGSSGGGKTHLLRTILSACPIIWAEINVTEYSDVGYMGRDLTTMYSGLVTEHWRGQKGKDEVFWTQREAVANGERFGVMLLDEFDKIRMTGDTKPGRRKSNKGETGAERQVGRVLQAELLKLVEGTEIEVQRWQGDRGFTFRTHRVLHIAMGAFEGLPRLMNEIDNETYNEEHEPTATELQNLHMDVEPYDIQRYGFMQELVGRFSTIVPLPSLDQEAMARILNERIIPDYEKQMALEEITLDIDDSARSWITGQSARSNIGARSIVPLIEELTAETWPHAYPGCTVAITAESVHRRTSVLIEPAQAVAM